MLSSQSALFLCLSTALFSWLQPQLTRTQLSSAPVDLRRAAISRSRRWPTASQLLGGSVVRLWSVARPSSSILLIACFILWAGAVFLETQCMHLKNVALLCRSVSTLESMLTCQTFEACSKTCWCRCTCETCKTCWNVVEVVCMLTGSGGVRFCFRVPLFLQ